MATPVLLCYPEARQQTPAATATLSWLHQVNTFSSFLPLQNQSRWKAMSEEALQSVCAPGSTTSLPPMPPLCAPSLDPSAASNLLELELRYLVSEHRKVKHSTGLDVDPLPL